MAHLKWHESTHWVRPDAVIQAITTKPHIFKKSAAQIEAEVRDDPKNNAINENQMWHLIDLAVGAARKNGTLLEAVENQVIGDLING